MKKILLSLGLFSLVLVGRSQVVLNEIYGNPGSGNSEFIELYNSSAAGAISTDCMTILAYYEEGANTGWYVIDLPTGVIAPKGWYTVGSANPINVQSQTNVAMNANWNSLAATGYLKKYQRSGATYTEVAAGTVTDMLQETSPTGAGGQNYFVFLVENGVKTNAFWGGGPSGTLPAGITGMPNLSLTPAGVGCAGAFVVNFSTWGAVEFFNPSGGSDNGYARKCDGSCGSWDKTSASVNHTPNATNGSATTCVNTPMTTAEFINCGTSPRFVSADITGLGAGGATEADDFPVEVTAYADINGNNLLDGLDIAINGVPALINTVAQAPVTINVPALYQNNKVIVVYETKRGCFDKVVALPNNCIILPVNFKSFTATRSGLNVNLRWETMTESNNSGFAIERKTAGGWEQVAFIQSQAPNGNSSSLLVYSYTDANAFKGISQYRLRQVDFDNRSVTSEIKAVRGDNNNAQLLVYPNPSNNGIVNVVFEDGSAIRDVTLSDMAGRVVRQMKGVSNNNIQFDNLLPGVYSLRVVDRETGEQNVQKIVVNKR